jgi:hypothetical protein
MIVPVTHEAFIVKVALVIKAFAVAIGQPCFEMPFYSKGPVQVILLAFAVVL